MSTGEKTKLLWKNPKYREMMSNVHKGKKYPEHSKIMKGNKNAFRNRTIEVLCPICKKNKFKKFKSQNKKYCSKECRKITLQKQMKGNKFRKGIKPSPLVLKNLCRKLGKEHFNWKGGITPLLNKIRSSKKYIKWHKSICKRDNWICNNCNKKQGWDKKNKININVEVHHKKPFCLIIEENKITTYKKAMECKELWNVDNGIVLCVECHNKTKYGKYTKIQSSK